MLSLSALLQRSTIDDHEEILNACNTLLKQSKGDLEAQRIKCLALLKLERYEDALRVLEQGGEPVKQKCQLERAYALYKNGDLRQAKEIAKQIANRGARHVEAQASYRLEEFADAASLYDDLRSAAAIENEENDVRVNRGATSAQLEWQGHGHLVKKKMPSREDQEAFETAFNAACASIARGELDQGEILLNRARDLCNLSEELSEQEKATEVLPIAVQQLYILKRLGKTEEAETVASQIALPDVTDLSTRQIAQSNKFASTSKSPNPFLTHRIFQSMPILPKSDKLFQFQTELIQENSIALDIMALKYSDVIKHTSRICSSSASPTTSAHINKISVLNAAAHAQNQLGKLGLKQILPLVQKQPNDIGLVLTIIQLYMLTNNPGSASTVLESLLKRLADSASPADQDVIFAPGLIATLVSLYTSEGRKSQIVTLLAKAASYWRHKSKPPIPLLEAAGLALLKSQVLEHHQLALDIFSSLRSLNPTSRLATAGYVAAHTLTSSDTSDPPPETNTLTPVPRLVAGIDAAALEAAGIPSRTAADSAAIAALASRKRALNEAPKPAKKRIRKSRLPKTYDPEKPPDPERWLPLRDRSSYKPKGKKGRQKAAALTQGGVSVAAGAGGATDGGAGASKPASSEGVIKAQNAPVKSKKKKGKK